MDAPIPGTAGFDRIRNDPRVWHFAFHGARDVAEMLVAGRERQYLQSFFNARCFDPSGISETDLDIYASVYAAPGAMRAGFELYRAFDQDATDNREALRSKGKLTMPVLAIGGAISTSGSLTKAVTRPRRWGQRSGNTRFLSARFWRASSIVPVRRPNCWIWARSKPSWR